MKWLGHVWRVGPASTIYTIMEWEPASRRKRGRPRSKWLNEVKKETSTGSELTSGKIK